MSNQKIYTSVKTMKDLFEKGFEIADPTTGELVKISYFIIERGLTIYDCCKFLRGKFNRLTSFSDKVAFLAILSLGAFSDDEIYHSFYLPSTARCMNEYKKIEKKFKNHERIMVEFNLDNDRIEVDFFSAKPIQCIYWDAEGWLHIKRY